MKLDILIDGETTNILEASGTPSEIMAMACCSLDSIAELISSESTISKAYLLNVMGQSVLMIADAHNLRESAAAD